MGGRKRKKLAAAKSDPRIRKTRSAIRSAFIRLMQEKEFDAITVKDIAECAQINRKTFYAHYETKEQIFAQMIEEMFSDLFGTFMYAKPNPGIALDEARLVADALCFFEKVESYREELDTLIGGRTAYMAFEIADGVIRSNLEDIHVTVGDEAGLVPSSLYVSRIKNFFFTGIDWWLEQTEYSAQQAAEIYSRMMRKSAASMFRYERMRSARKE